MTVAFPAFLDTCVLYPAYLCDTLLRLAEASAYRPLWSADVLAELWRNVIERGIPPKRVDRRPAHMTRSFPDALVTGCESLIDGMTNHPKDRHVLTAAVRANAEVNVTFIEPAEYRAVLGDEHVKAQAPASCSASEALYRSVNWSKKSSPRSETEAAK